MNGTFTNYLTRQIAFPKVPPTTYKLMEEEFQICKVRTYSIFYREVSLERKAFMPSTANVLWFQLKGPLKNFAHFQELAIYETAWATNIGSKTLHKVSMCRTWLNVLIDVKDWDFADLSVTCTAIMDLATVTIVCYLPSTLRMLITSVIQIGICMKCWNPISVAEGLLRTIKEDLDCFSSFLKLYKVSFVTSKH